MNVLVINAGSSSLKYQLLNPATGALLAKGLCERIGIDGKFTYKPQLEGKEAIKAADVAMPTHNDAIAAVLNALVDEKNGVIGSMKEIDAVGHRVVHGGEKFAKSVVITDEVMAAIEECNPLAPLHNPANIIGIKACQELMPGVPMVAVFDTAFHQTMPPVAYTYALPYEYYEKDKVRRYGFHGTSHKYVSQRAADMLGKPIEQLKLISCHLGNGSSVTAIDGGKSIADAGRLLLFYVTNALNSNMSFDSPDMRILRNLGGLPTLLECGRFRIRIHSIHAPELRLYVLDLSGKRGRMIPPSRTGKNEAEFFVDTAAAGCTSLCFEIVRQP